jgi:hypothetical protein
LQPQRTSASRRVVSALSHTASCPGTTSWQPAVLIARAISALAHQMPHGRPARRQAATMRAMASPSTGWSRAAPGPGPSAMPRSPGPSKPAAWAESRLIQPATAAPPAATIRPRNGS